ncbi:MAG: 5'-methylthioadenosine phosphorylase [Gemmatimonadetes bacterium]|nr:MTAP family purine nucleoside phosphorylase [Gemmatimonadota bacterium]NIQ55448.1 MTAP family purine nucleoside phosphorylase [Gemmatimonadota bacterium]NIU75656.1 5'-methylthioadenosine phosphorylase [Gammaproteobacteria bacterium]NIX45331.1 5'-methylthioadenosine phosphorylase [Gemmatimonadota bacterium]NIY09614.1 5'-methylthioadenosine phosphorylase [Gemmatimonadota bacterium]
MDTLGIVGGSAFLRGLPPGGTEEERVSTARGDVVAHVGDGFVFLRRHGEEGYRPPHRVRHHAHALALVELGVDAAVGLCSLGALDPALEPGTVVVPEDYLSLAPPPTLAADDERLHIIPGLDPSLRAILLAAARETLGHVHDGGVYAETRGPRFETRAEIRLLADYADVVGMTAASEATLFQEAGLRYAVLGLVDNYANGIGEETLTLDKYEERLEKNRARARAILDELIHLAPHADTAPESAGS